MNKNQENKVKEISEGEQFISEFLEESSIDFTHEIRLNNLIGDSVPYRIADFFLPKYKCYIEFFGQWNVSEEHKQRYREKKRVYDENRIPCIYLYPENLGILPFIFEHRLRKTLKKHKLTWQLFKLNWFTFQEKAGIGIIFLGFIIYYVPQILWKIPFVALLAYHVYDHSKKTFFK